MAPKKATEVSHSNNLKEGGPYMEILAKVGKEWLIILKY